MSDKVEIDPDWLRQRYVREGGTLKDIADEKGCSVATVHNRMEEHGIPRVATQDIESHTVECAYCDRKKEVQRHQYEKRERFYCDNACQGKYLAETDETSGENNGRWKGKVTVECAYCGANLDVYPSRLKQKDNHLCDNDCRGKWQSEYLSGENHPLWEGHRSNYYNGPWRRVRRQVKERDSDTCQLCGDRRSALDRAPDVHHIRPVKRFEHPADAHEPLNLVQLCTKCHRFMESRSVENQHTLLQLLESGPYQVRMSGSDVAL